MSPVKGFAQEENTMTQPGMKPDLTVSKLNAMLLYLPFYNQTLLIKSWLKFISYLQEFRSCSGDPFPTAKKTMK